MRVRLIVVGAVASTLTLAACGGSGEGDTGSGGSADRLKFTVGQTLSKETHWGQGVEELTDSLQGSLGTDAAVTHASDGTLGAEADMLEAVQLGSLEMAVLSTPVLTSVVPKLGVFDLPYIWEDLDHFFSVMDSELALDLAADAESNGFVVVDYWMGGIRNMYGNVRVEEPSDLDGVKIRILQSPVFEATFEAFGASPTPVDWPETYQALQLGTVDEAETNLASIVDAKQNEVIDYVTRSQHAINASAVVVNAKWWNGLDDETQDALRAAVADGKAVTRDVYLDLEAKAVAALEADGIEIVEPDVEAFRELAEPVINRFAEELGADAVEDVRSQAAS